MARGRQCISDHGNSPVCWTVQVHNKNKSSKVCSISHLLRESTADHRNQQNALRWRHNGRDCVSNHQPRDCLLKRLFGRRWKQTSKLRVTGFCAGISPVTGELPTQRASNAENVSIWLRHHGNNASQITGTRLFCGQFTFTSPQRSALLAICHQHKSTSNASSIFSWRHYR